MKKINLFLVIVFYACLAIFTSCNWGDVPNSTKLTWTQDADTVEVGVATTVTFVITMEPDILNNISVTNLFIEENGVTLDSVVFTQVAQTVTYTYEYDVLASADEGDIDLLFTAWDDNNGIITETATIVVGESEITLPSIITSTNNTVNYNSTSATTQFGWVLDPTAKGVTISQVNSADADLVFFFNDTYRQQLLSPNAAQIEAQDAFSTWSYDVAGKNTTKIQKVTASDWTNATEASINDLTVTSGTHAGGGNGYANVAVDDVYAFELSDGRKGLCKVSASNPPYKSPLIASTITLDFKYQESGSAGK